MTPKPSICVAGIGIASPLGIGVEPVWAALERGETPSAPRIPEFDPSRFLKRRYLRPLDDVTVRCIAMVGAAIHDAGLAEAGVNPDRVSVVVGSVFAGIGCIFAFKQACHEGVATRYLGLSPLYFPGIVYNSLSGQPAIEFGFTGPNVVVNAGYSSGLLAVIKGIEYIRHGKADVVVAGGAEMLHPFVLEKVRRDREAGVVAEPGKELSVSEAVCLFVLRRADDPRFRGGRQYGTLEGTSVGFSGATDRVPILARAIRAASSEASAEVTSVVMDGSLSAVSSAAERAAVARATGGRPVALVSNKTNFGHALGASSSLNLFHGLMLARSPANGGGAVLVNSLDARGNHAFVSVKAGVFHG